MTEPDDSQQPRPEHDIVWHWKRWYAAGAITFAAFILILLACLFIGGPDAMQSWAERWSFFVNPLIWLAALPFVYRRLR